MRQITYAELQSYIRHGYASTRDGQLFVLSLDKQTGGTTLEPVAVMMNTAQLREGARQAELQCDWLRACDLWLIAAELYPTNTGALAKLDIARMREKAHACRRQAVLDATVAA